MDRHDRLSSPAAGRPAQAGRSRARTQRTARRSARQCQVPQRRATAASRRREATGDAGPTQGSAAARRRALRCRPRRPRAFPRHHGSVRSSTSTADLCVLRRVMRGTPPPTDLRQSKARIVADPGKLGQIHPGGRGHPYPARRDLSHRSEGYVVWRGLDGVPRAVPVPEAILPDPGKLAADRIGIFPATSRPSGDQPLDAWMALNIHVLRCYLGLSPMRSAPSWQSGFRDARTSRSPGSAWPGA